MKMMVWMEISAKRNTKLLTNKKLRLKLFSILEGRRFRIRDFKNRERIEK